jgi:L-ascorbate 6-phosphate lactonase
VIDAIAQTDIAPGSLGVWSLGQSGFVFKNGAGMTVSIDPCLGDPVREVSEEWSRLYPSPVQPEEFVCDVMLITHDHLDHLDPQTISRLGRDAVGMFVGPGNACRHLEKLGVPPERIFRLDAAREMNLDGLELRGMLAVTNDSDQPDAEGMLIRLPDAPSVYHTGDTAFSPLLAKAAAHRPDVLMPCINGRFGNMDAFEAAVLAAAVRPKWAIPHHYDMFRHNLADPQAFADALKELDLDCRFAALAPGESEILQGDQAV